jgi:hypothetical protein
LYVTNEILALLLDDELDPNRRRQILLHIASDNELSMSCALIRAFEEYDRLRIEGGSHV